MKAFKTTILLTFFLLNLALDAQNTVKIGKQVWASKNLDVVIFRNGDTIPEVKTFEAWQQAANEEKPAWCYQANLPEYGEKYGKLYNWYAVNDPRGLAPKGYHIPTKAEWDSLVSYIDGEETAGGEKLKSSEGWFNDANGTNESGFSGLPGGLRLYDGDFLNIGKNSDWWSATENDASNAWRFGLLYRNTHLGSGYYLKGFGFSVRCLMD